MSQLSNTLQTTLAGCIAQNLPDSEIRKVIMSIVDDDKTELTTYQAADILKKSESTLKRWRMDGIGPRYRRDPGGNVRYRVDWLREHLKLGVVSG